VQEALKKEKEFEESKIMSGKKFPGVELVYQLKLAF